MEGQAWGLQTRSGMFAPRIIVDHVSSALAALFVFRGYHGRHGGHHIITVALKVHGGRPF